MKRRDWQTQLRELAARFTAYGIDADLASLTLAEAWGVYRFLLRLAAGGGDA